jgi:hypothetical protein
MNGAVVSNSYATPYTVVTIATFVPNPMAPPSYYLKLQQTITNFHPTTNFSFGFELAGYVPYNDTTKVRFPASCSAVDSGCFNASIPDLIGGLYPNASLTAGTAFFVSPQASWSGPEATFTSFGTDDINQNQSTHLFTNNWILGPGTSRTVVWYVLVGDWNKVLSFASLN